MKHVNETASVMKDLDLIENLQSQLRNLMEAIDEADTKCETIEVAPMLRETKEELENARGSLLLIHKYLRTRL